MLSFHDNPPLSLYVHLPWCVKKCPYCDFNSHALATDALPEADYVAALVRDLEFALPQIWGRRIGSIFIGGGTPSLFSGTAINDLLCALHARLNFNPEIEITLEANPGTVDSTHFRDYQAAGVNRLSLGVQSFNNDHLAALGRIHDADAARRAIDMARDAGVTNINVDLMFGLPNQSVANAMEDLECAIAYEPQHVSWYQLTIEPNTVFYSQRPKLPGDDDLWDMQQNGRQFLDENGYRQYEVSAYARDAHQCFHNRNYWEFGDYLGIGAGAHSKLTDVTTGIIKREARHRIPATWMEHAGNGDAVTSSRKLGLADVGLEFMMNALRLSDGFPTHLFMERCGMPLLNVKQPLQEAERKGLIHWDRERITPTELGRRYLDDLTGLFL